MSQKVLLIAVLCLSLVAFGQTGARNSSPTLTANPVQTQPIAVGNGLGWTAGTVGYYGEGPAGGVLLNTPTASFDSPQPTAGVSIAGRAGISDSNPLNTGVQSSASSSTLVYSNLPPEVPATEEPATEPAAAESPATAAVSPTARANDYGPSFFSNETGGPAMNGPSLAEIAERYRNSQATQSVRTYTNRDVRPPANVADAENILLARNTAPPSPQSTASTTSSEQRAQPSAGTSAQAASTEQQAQSSNQSQQLPGSSTLLPLLGLLGIMTGGLGLWLRGSGHRKTS